jgi:hypothetical protein
MTYPSPTATVRGLKVLFPNADFLRDIGVYVTNNIVTHIVTPHPVTPEEIEAAALTAQEPVKACTLSKLVLTRRLRDIGKEDAFWAILTAQPILYREFILAQELRTDDPMFTSQAPILKAALGLTDEQFTNLIKP